MNNIKLGGACALASVKFMATVHNTLSHLAENFDYPAILKALQAD